MLVLNSVLVSTLRKINASDELTIFFKCIKKTALFDS